MEADQQREPDPPPGSTGPGAQSAQAIRFCRTCGAAWQPEWERCAVCAPENQVSDAVLLDRYRHDRAQVKSAVWLYFALLAVSMVMLLVVLFSDGRWTVNLDFGGQIAMSTLIVAWCIANRQEVLPLLRKSAPPQYFLLAAGGAVVTYALASGIIALLVKYAGLEEMSYREPFDEAKLGIGWIVFSICVQPAVFEELAFRGVIFSALSRVLGNTEALLVSALMFAILHLSMPSLPHLFVLGLALGWLRIRTGSLFPCVVLHFSHNLLVVVSEEYGRWLPW